MRQPRPCSLRCIISSALSLSLANLLPLLFVAVEMFWKWRVTPIIHIGVILIFSFFTGWWLDYVILPVQAHYNKRIIIWYVCGHENTSLMFVHFIASSREKCDPDTSEIEKFIHRLSLYVHSDGDNPLEYAIPIAHSHIHQALNNSSVCLN